MPLFLRKVSYKDEQILEEYKEQQNVEEDFFYTLEIVLNWLWNNLFFKSAFSIYFSLTHNCCRRRSFE